VPDPIRGMLAVSMCNVPLEKPVVTGVKFRLNRML
jgi:hypothetical protein